MFFFCSRLLNKPNKGAPQSAIVSCAEDLAGLQRLLDPDPKGVTPLCQAVKEVVAILTPLAPAYRANGQKACVILAIDGEVLGVPPAHNKGPCEGGLGESRHQ